MAQIELQPALQAAIQAAKKAAPILQHYAAHRKDLVIDFKQHNDLVSKADKETEQAIIRTLNKLTPDYGIIAEESGGEAKGPAFWVIDPLDGTTNFLHGLPFYAISIALVAQANTIFDNQSLPHTTPVVGVIYDPNRNEFFTACHGQGAWLDQT